MAQKSFYEMIQPEGMYRAATYDHGMRAGNTIYVAGQVARDDAGKLVGIGDPAAQARQIYANLERVLHAAGADWSHVVKINTFLTDRAYSEAVTQVRLEKFGAHRPPHTGLVIAGLGSPEVLMEVEVIAVLPPDEASLT